MKELKNTVEQFQIALNVLKFMCDHCKDKQHHLVNFQYSMKYILETGNAYATELERLKSYHKDMPLFSTVNSKGGHKAEEAIDFLKQIYKTPAAPVISLPRV